MQILYKYCANIVQKNSWSKKFDRLNPRRGKKIVGLKLCFFWLGEVKKNLGQKFLVKKFLVVQHQSSCQT